MTAVGVGAAGLFLPSIGMNIGKREQIVILVVTGVVAIGGLHWIVFRQRANEFVEAFEELEERRGEAEQVRVLPNIALLEAFERENEVIHQAYSDALTTIGLTMHPAFEVIHFDDVTDDKLEPPPAPGADPGEINRRRRELHQKLAQEKYDEQIALLFEELARLRGLAQAARPGQTDLSFLRQDSWNLPLTLPAGMQGGRLLTALHQARDNLMIMRRVDPNNPTWQQTRTGYEAELAKLGIDNNLYLQGTLPLQGEYVGLLHKVMYVLLIEEALGPNAEIAGVRITRDFLLDLLEIQLPLEPLKGSDDTELDVNEMYFIYEQLRFLNRLLELATRNEVAEVAGVQFEDAAYLVQFNIGFANPDLTPSPTPAPTPPPRNIYVLPTPTPTGSGSTSGSGGEGGQRASLPSENDIGYSVPILITFRARNSNAMKFVYETLGQFAMVELDQFSVISSPGQGGQHELWFQVRFLAVPFLFALEEQIKAAGRQMVEAGSAATVSTPGPGSSGP